jgi:hypothetical protein
MSVHKTSRYARSPTVVVRDRLGEEYELLELRDIPRPVGVLSVTPTEADRLDVLAHRFYRDPLKFWKICDASPLLDPFLTVTVGEPLLIPPDK